MVAKQPGGRPGMMALARLLCRTPTAHPQPSSKEVSAMVWVNAYTRIRFGRLESVSAHWRSLP